MLVNIKIASKYKDEEIFRKNTYSMNETQIIVSITRFVTPLEETRMYWEGPPAGNIDCT